MTRAHYTHKYMSNPQHPLTVNVIGAGGTGSQVVTCLGRLDATLAALGHPGLYVRVYDPDDVDTPNIGRQKFGDADLGRNKAECLVTRINAFFGTGWEAVPAKYPTTMKDMKKDDLANIYITCTDNITSRYELSTLLKLLLDWRKAKNRTDIDYSCPLYWMDYGNNQKTGQVIVGTLSAKIDQPKNGKFEGVAKLPWITDLDGYNGLSDDDSGPSCSHAEALAKQDLFINSTLAELGMTILWRMIRQGYILQHGVFLNLETMTMNPMPV
ncbi:PRTRC system ThiF family protein [Alistipes sp. OttesenSCG-928-L06]|nr:PRTRC system ThiF family protein [Alistipes sp. OttesenSCG-928-L06]